MSKTNSSSAMAIVATAVVVSTTTLVLWIRWKKQSKSSPAVSEIHVYPIKSCAQSTLDCAIPTPQGFEGDRMLQVTDGNGKYCTPRDPDKAKLFQISVELWGDGLTLEAPNMEQPLDLDLTTTNTTTPVKVEVLEAPEKLTLQDYGDKAAAWLEQATGIPKCRLTGIGPEFERFAQVNSAQGDAIPTYTAAPMSLADEAPYLLTNQASLDDLNKRLKARGKDPVDMRRFRPNLVVKGLKPWQEDCLKKVRIHHVEFHVWQRCGRCIMTTIDRDTLKRGPEPLATLSTFREREHGMRNFGMHLIPVLPIPEGATITVDDEVEILEYDEDRLAEWKRLFG